MKLNILGLSIASLIAYCEAKTFNFNVVSIKGEGFNLGVKYNNEVKPLNATHFPLFSGSVEADNITKYKYVVLDSTGKAAEEESVDRTYSEITSKTNEVYDRVNKDVEIPVLPQPFNSMFPMGCDEFKPIPNNVIYNVYANCDPNAYSDVSGTPFLEGQQPNLTPVNCTITIVSPNKVYSSKGVMRVIGFGSRFYKKLSWNVKFDKKFLGRKSIKLRGIANDPTFIRENLVTELYKSVGVPVQEGSYARLFINGDTYGLYSIIDSFSKKWIAGYVHGDIKAKTGYSYKIFSNEPQFADFQYKGENHEEYVLYKPDEYDDQEASLENSQTLYPPLINFLKQLSEWEATPGKPIDQLGKFFNIEAFVRLMVIDTLSIGLDNFLLHVSNAAIYYNPTKKNYMIIPFDFDEALRGGQDDEALDKATYMSDCHTWAFQKEEVFTHRFAKTILEHPDIRKRYDVVLSKTVAELFNRKVITDYVNAVADLIRGDIQWTNDAIVSLAIPYKGYVNHYTVQQFEGNMDKLQVIETEEIVNGNEFGLLQFVDVRGDACKAATQSVDTSNNENISDKEIVPVYKKGIETDDTESNLKASGAMTILPSLTITLGMISLVQLLSFLF